MQVDRADISKVLADIRSLRTQMARPAEINTDDLRPSQPNAVAKPQEASFTGALAQALNAVNSLQQQNSALQTAYEKGDPSVDITRVMIAGQKASVGFQALTQVRNRMVQAYEDIMKMPI